MASATTTPLPSVLPDVSSLAVPSSEQPNLLLDSAIRDWVVLPLLVIMVSAGLLRYYVGQLLRPSPRPLPARDARAKSAIARSARLRSGASGYLSKSKWEGRRRYMSRAPNADSKSDTGSGFLRQEAEWIETEDLQKKEAEERGEAVKEDDKAGQPDLMNPASLMDGMKGNMVAMVQNMVMMQGISHFFRGYVLVRVPFPLTNGFKMMFQRGLELSTLDTSYVSSVSWYFLVMFGLRAFFRLVIGDASPEEAASMEVQKSMGVSPGGGNPTQQFDAPKMLRQEAENLDLARFATGKVLDDVERRLLGSRYPKQRVFATTRGGGAGGAEDILGLGRGGASATAASSANIAATSSATKKKKTKKSIKTPKEK